MKTFDPENIVWEVKAENLGEKIVNVFSKFGIIIAILDYWLASGRIVFLIKMKRNTRETMLRSRLQDVQTRLKLPQLELYKHNQQLYLVSSDHKIEYPHLPILLNFPEMQKRMEAFVLPYVIGYDLLGLPMVIDLADAPHLLFGGSTNSGKTVGAQALIASVVKNKSPSQVDFILIDVGAADLMVFEGLPHLSCHIVSDFNTAYQKLAALRTEMERRIELKAADLSAFERLPRLVLVIDEFPALFMSTNSKVMNKSVSDTVSSLLQRGRHAKIHVVLAAQNPTIQNMKVDLGNVSTRIAFRCAKKNFSEVILGEGGAENLSGKGSLLLKAPQYDSLQQLQGVYINPDELQKLVHEIIWTVPSAASNKFVLDTSNMELPQMFHPSSDTLDCLPSADDKMLAQVIFWVLGKEVVSTNQIQSYFGIGWNRADSFMSQLESLGVVDKLYGKQARHVLPMSVGELHHALISFMEICGYTKEELHNAIDFRD